jgi:hypothetical protein
MRKLRLTGVAGLVVAAVLIPAGVADAKQSTTGCPKKWTPVTEMGLPQGSRDRDNNENGIVCAKGPQGSNQHFNTKDDNTNQTVAPVFWYSFLIDETPLTEDIFIVIDNMNLYIGGVYIDPAPEDLADDTPR